MMRPIALLPALLGGLTVAAACEHRHIIAVVSHSSAMGGAAGTASDGGGSDGGAGGAGGTRDGGGIGAGGVRDAGDEPLEAGVPDVGPLEAGVPDVGSDGAADDGKDGGLPRVNIVSQGSSSFIDLFAVPQALYVVTSTALMAFDASDGLQFEHDFSREVTAAAQEGDLLAVADRAAVTPFTRLVPGTETLLVEACASAVIVGGNRFVCGPFDDTNRVFRTYDLDARAAIAQSDSYVYIGIPMRRVPGRDSFVSVDVNQFPSDFRLFDVDSTGKASYVNESPYHGDFAVTPTYAFDATPAARVIQETGLILDIYGSAASPCTSAFPSNCFVKDGALGTLRGAEYFAALTEGGDGKVIGLVAPDRTQEGCQAGCSFQIIDIAARSASVITTYTPMGAGKIVVARSAPSPARTLYVGYDLGGTGAAPGYRVEAIRY